MGLPTIPTKVFGQKGVHICWTLNVTNNKISWVGRDASGSSRPTPGSAQGISSMASRAWDCCPNAFWAQTGWCCDHFLGQPVPVPNHPLGEKPYPSNSLISLKLKQHLFKQYKPFATAQLQHEHLLTPRLQHRTVKGTWLHFTYIPSQIHPQYLKMTIWIFKSAVHSVYNPLSANSLYYSSQLQVSI